MKAIVFKGPNNFDYEEVPTPKCPDNGILVKVESVGLCGSDVRTFGAGHNKVTPPFIIGHEAAGIVVQSKAKDFIEGDRVVVNPVIPCKECSMCKKGLENHCKDIMFVGNNIPGAYAQYVAIPERGANKDIVIKVNEDANLDLMPLGETLSSVYSTQHYAGVNKGDTVVIIGAGPLGNLHSAVAKALGAKTVILSEMSEDRLEKAKRFKTTDIFVNPNKENLLDIIMKETGGDGADMVITACPVGVVQEQATHYVRPRGKVLLFGGLPKDKNVVGFDSNLIHYKEIALYGGYAYSSNVFKKCVGLIEDGTIDAAPFITDVLPLKDIKKGIELIKGGHTIKVILKPFVE